VVQIPRVQRAVGELNAVTHLPVQKTVRVGGIKWYKEEREGYVSGLYVQTYPTGALNLFHRKDGTDTNEEADGESCISGCNHRVRWERLL